MEAAGSRPLGVSLSVYTCLVSQRTRGGGEYIFSAMVPVQWSLLSDSRGLLSLSFSPFSSSKVLPGDTGLRAGPKTM